MKGERERKEQIIRDEIESYRRKWENAQVRYAYGSRSAERTMDKYSTLESALENYLDSLDGRTAQSEQLLKIADAMKKAEKHIELYGPKSLPVQQVVAEVKRILFGG